MFPFDMLSFMNDPFYFPSLFDFSFYPKFWSHAINKFSKSYVKAYYKLKTRKNIHIDCSFYLGS